MGGYAGRHPAAPGLLISAGCACLFVAIAAGVLTGGPLARFDLWVAEALHAHASGAPVLTEAVRVVGVLGSLAALALVGFGRLACGGSRWRGAERAPQGTLRPAPAPLRSPARGRDLPQLPQRAG